MVDKTYRPHSMAERKNVSADGCMSICGYLCKVSILAGTSDIEYVTTVFGFKTRAKALKVEKQLDAYIALCRNQYE